ncbi:MAG: CARDB domain-containing protein, partial [Hyalangium sp.]|uniref:CARDB domain-containing protein n=1 Tax=Hyalangium sp. TaxID=2028555 RepID=UPI00389AC261
DVEVYLSTDDAIHAYAYPYPGPPEDSLVGSASTNVLNPNQCVTVPVSGNAYTPPPGMDGPYYVGAVVDPRGMRPELIEDNNALAGYRMGVGNRPDFVVTSVTGPASVQNGNPLSTQVTVCNRGTLADSTDVEVYLSADDTIRADADPSSGAPKDSWVGSAATGYLYPNQCATVPVNGNAYLIPPGSDGPYYVGAIVDPHGTRPELIDDNNALTGYRIGVGSGPDFVVTAVTGPASVQSGQLLSTQVTVCNRGTQADSSDVDVYLSAVPLPASGPSGPPAPLDVTFVGTAPTGYLYPSQCVTVPVNGKVYSPPPPGTDGPYYVDAFVDPHHSRPELIEDNNVLAGYQLGLGTKADFVITSVTGPYSAQPGSSVSLSVGVCNRGQMADTVDVELYLSADTNVQVPAPPGPPEDFFLGPVSNISLSAGACTTLSLVVTMPSVPEGAYYLGAVADPHGMRSELIENNNAKAGNVIGVGTKADFVVTAVTGPSSVKPGAAFTASVTVCNRGQMADSASVDLYLSADDNIRVPTPPGPPEDFFLGTVPSGSLATGACITRSLSVTAPSVPDGAYYLGAVADPNNTRSELIEDNNAKAGNVIGVGSKADFVVTAVTGPASIRLGAAFSASITVCNRGQLTDTTDVDLYFSADSTIRVPTPPIPPEDFYLGRLTGVSLPVGACTTRSLVVSANAPATGSYYLGAVADAANAHSELIEDNNTKAGTYMSVTP